MTVLIIVAAVVLVCLAAATERIVKLRRRAHQRRQMAYRLTAAAARAEVAERKRKARVAASAQLTSVIPAINKPHPGFDVVAKQAQQVPAPRQHDAGAGPRRPAASSGPWQVHRPAPPPTRPLTAPTAGQPHDPEGPGHSAE